jgi:DNA-binding NtrC family response regulator
MTKVLVIDDDDNVCKYIKLVIKSEWPACKVLEANGPISAEQKLKENGIALIVCDVRLNSITGPQVLAANRKLVGQTKIILLSCSDEYQKAGQDLIRQGFRVVDSIQKPIYPNDLRQLFNLHLND